MMRLASSLQYVERSTRSSKLNIAGKMKQEIGRFSGKKQLKISSDTWFGMVGRTGIEPATFGV